LGDERERLARREDADGAKRIEGPQILIAGDDEAGVGGERTGEHLIVIGIATDWDDRGGAHELREGAVTGDEVGNGAADLEDACGELLASENVLQFGDERGAGEEVRRCARAAASTSAGTPPHRNAETTVLVSATARTIGAGGCDLGVDLRFGERGLEGGELVHGGEQLLDLSLLHGLTQQPLDGIGAQESGGLSLLGKFIGQRDGDVGHDNTP
jgi:hypothetical protein